MKDFQKILTNQKRQRTSYQLEMRNDTVIHYREIRFNMMKQKAMKLLYSKITLKQNYTDDVIVYGEAIKHFGRWRKN